MSGWIGVDLDGTLAEYGGWRGGDHIGNPVPAMAFRVRNWIANGKTVKIFTARATVPEQVRVVEDWCELHFGVRLEVTATKDFAMTELWDDRAIRVRPNKGEPCCNYRGEG